MHYNSKSGFNKRNIGGFRKKYNRESNVDYINHPPHYTFSSIEVIDLIEDWNLGYHIGNVVKYIGRAGKKNGYVSDLRKACWYLNRAIEKNVKKNIVSNNSRYSLEDVKREWKLNDKLYIVFDFIYNGDYESALKNLYEYIESVKKSSYNKRDKVFNRENK